MVTALGVGAMASMFVLGLATILGGAQLVRREVEKCGQENKD